MTAREQLNNDYPLKCLNCSVQWQHDKLKDIEPLERHHTFSTMFVRDIRCPGCGSLSVLTDEYKLYAR